eukprot:719201-Rhodomonas_salina.1
MEPMLEDHVKTVGVNTRMKNNTRRRHDGIGPQHCPERALGARRVVGDSLQRDLQFRNFQGPLQL